MKEKEIIIDIWRTDAHSVEIGIKKKDEFRAKSRQFTADTDIIGEISGDMEGYVTYRQSPWESDDLEQRLVLKIFTKSINWKGTLEELVSQGYTRSLGSSQMLPVFTINLSNNDFQIIIDRVFKPKSLNKEMYTFMIIEDGISYPYRIEADRFTLGSDWDVFNHHDNKIAKIDGSAFNMGGKWKIHINKGITLPSSFDEVLVLFCCQLKFIENIMDRYERVVKSLKKDEELNIKVENDEISLYQNPRRIRK
ncbi:MAG: hypothetical protein OEY49_12445 [Candidatus Heimdallarchaeota archaeon]|nr:hypothetical protein [Candidatus Heimdallarchaeota archaeon]